MNKKDIIFISLMGIACLLFLMAILGLTNSLQGTHSMMSSLEYAVLSEKLSESNPALSENYLRASNYYKEKAIKESCRFPNKFYIKRCFGGKKWEKY